MIHSFALFFNKGTLGISSEHGHIKDALSRIVVEIAKREWPQQWMSMIKELDDISIQGVNFLLIHSYFIAAIIN